MRANRLSGALMFSVFGGLILTGVALYYGGDEQFRAASQWTHQILGLLFPLTLGWHAFVGWRRVKNV